MKKKSLVRTKDTSSDILDVLPMEDYYPNRKNKKKRSWNVSDNRYDKALNEVRYGGFQGRSDVEEVEC